ncbi:MAG: phage tail tape measure protein [Syntrophorhabdaceae bacterium]|nr:phage tail tape measure protein [Syntrophorhabdaceae bacterium]
MNELSLGQMVVQFSTDLSSLNKGLKDAEKKVQDTSGKITDLTNKIGKGLTVAGVAITGTFALMTKSVISYNEEIYRMSEQTGLSVETLSRLKYVAEQNESSFEAVATGIKFLSKNMYEAQTAGGAFADKFNNINVEFKNADGSLRKTEDVFFDIANHFKNMTDGAAKTGQAMDIFGRQGAALIPILDLGADGLKHAWEEADRLGITLNEMNAKALDDFGDSMSDIKNATMGLWITIVNYMAPALTDLAKKVTDFVVKLREWAEENPGLAKAITGFVVGFGAIALVAGPLIIMLTSLVSNIATISVAVTALGIPLAGIVAVLGEIVLVGAAAFAGWNIGKLIGEITGLDNALSGPDGLFTKMYTWLDEVMPKWERFIGFLGGTRNLASYDAINEQAALAEVSAISPSGGGTSDVDTAARIANITELADLSRNYYEGEIALHQMTLDDAVNSLALELQQEQLSYDQRQALVTVYYEYVQQRQRSVANEAYQVVNRISTTLASGLTNMITGVQSFSEAWKNMWTSLGTYLVQVVLQKIIDKLLELIGLQAMIEGVLAVIGLQTGGMVTASGNKVPLPSAANGMFISGPPGPMPVIIHPPEVIAPYDKFMEMVGGGGSGGVNVNFNNYGDIASDVDISDIMTRIGQSVKKAIKE